VSNCSVVKIHVKVLRRSRLLLYDSEFRTDGVLTLSNFINNDSAVHSTDIHNLSDDCNVFAGV